MASKLGHQSYYKFARPFGILNHPFWKSVISFGKEGFIPYAPPKKDTQHQHEPFSASKVLRGFVTLSGSSFGEGYSNGKELQVASSGIPDISTLGQMNEYILSNMRMIDVSASCKYE